jgi:hypothetical protein
MLAPQEREVQIRRSSRFKSADTASVIFVKRVPVRSLAVAILHLEINLEKLILSVKDHKAIYNASHG